MQHSIAAVRKASSDENPHAALTLALTLPDVCASLESSDGRTTGAKYAAWWDTYLLPTYTIQIGSPPVEHVFLTGGDCYALRCAVLHQGLDDVSEQNARQVLEKFHFVQPRNSNVVIHRNQAGLALNLQVDIFCEEICQGVEAWLCAIGARQDVLDRIEALMKIDDLSGGWSM